MKYHILYMSYFTVKYPVISKVPMRIRVFLDWDNPESAKKNIENEFNLHDIQEYETDFELTSGDNYTHAIIINKSMPNLNIPKENVVGFAWEPTPLLQLNEHFIEYARERIGRYFIGSSDLPQPFEDKYAFLNHNPIQKTIPEKTKFCSIIFSKKQFAEGHKYRNMLVQAILNSNLPIDIWGKGCDLISGGNNDPRIKGEFSQNSVVPYAEYQFHICVENFSIDHYFSEKIVNALLSETTPIYWGSKKICEYFPEKVIQLNGDIEKDIVIMRNCLENPGIYKKQIDRQEINKIVNPFLQLSQIFHK